MPEIKLGDIAEDRITGFRGTVVAITEWINNCRRITMQPKVDKDGKVPDAHTIDEPNAILVKAGPAHEPVRTGGPRPEPTRARDPR